MHPAIIKFLVLCVLCLQNSGITLVMRYSRGVLKERYLITSTVIVSEIIKLFICSFLVFKQLDYDVSKTLSRHVHMIRHSLLMFVPGLLYLIQNKLTYVGLQHLESSTYAVLSQLKLLATALFSVLLLKKKLAAFQWRALVLLFVGVVLVQPQQQLQQHQQTVVRTTNAVSAPLASNELKGETQPQQLKTGSQRRLLMMTHQYNELLSSSHSRFHVESVAAGVNNPSQSVSNSVTISSAAAATRASPSSTNVYIGSLAVVGIACLSAFAGVYFELMLKRGNEFNMWERNIQLSFYGVVFGLISLMMSSEDLQFLSQRSFFADWSAVTMLAVLLSSAGGLLVSIVIKLMDNILKGFSTSCAIVLTSLISAFYLHDLNIDTVFLCGIACVLLSVFNYNQDTSQANNKSDPVETGPAEEKFGLMRSEKERRPDVVLADNRSQHIKN